MNLDHEYYRAIGEFIFRVAQLENQLHEILWRALGIGNKEGRVLTVGTPIKAIRGMLYNVANDDMKGRWLDRKKNPSLVQRIESILVKAKPYAELRNRIAHGSWQSTVRGKHDPQIVYAKGRKISSQE